MEQKLEIFFRLGIAREDDLSAVGGRKMNVEHLFGGDAAIHDPDAVGFAILGFDFLEEVGEGGLVSGIEAQRRWPD